MTDLDPIRIPGDRTDGAQRRQAKRDVFEEYGGQCTCCGEDTPEFLSIDHTDNDGGEHRRNITSGIYTWLRRNNYPRDGFRILCMNCNWSRGQYGYCPHALAELDWWGRTESGDWARFPYAPIPLFTQARVFRKARDYIESREGADHIQCICGCGQSTSDPIYPFSHETCRRTFEDKYPEPADRGFLLLQWDIRKAEVDEQ